MFTASFPPPATSPVTRMNQQPVIALWQIISTRFDEQELRTLCFCLGLDYDDLPATGKMHKARELVTFLQRHDNIAALISAGRTLRPDIDWNTISPDAIDAMPMKQPAYTDQPSLVEEPLHALTQTIRTLAQALTICREQTDNTTLTQPYALYHCEGNTIVAVVALA